MPMAFQDDCFLDLLSGNTNTAAATAGSTTAATATTTTTSSGDEQGCDWGDWSAVMDWDGEFADLLESMMGDEATAMEPPLPPPHPPLLAYDHDQEVCNSILTDAMPADGIDLEEDPRPDDFKGLRLVHLLVAAAEALAGANKTRELTRVILSRLKELVSPSDRTNMERLAAYFTDGLSGLLERANASANRRQSQSSGLHQHRDDHNPADVAAAFQLFQDMSPYVNFGYLTANQAILEAVEYERRVHIVDYDITEGVQWASLMQAMVSRKTGPTVQHLRITALSRSINGRKSVAAVQEAGRRLTVFAESINQPFSFHHCRLDSDETFSSSSLKLVRGEAVVINCMLHLPRFTHHYPDNLISFLSEAKSLNPKLVTFVQEEVGLNCDQGFIGRFMDLLHQFSAMFDSLEAGFPITNQARGFVERVFLSPWISRSLTRITIGGDSESESSLAMARWFEADGYKPVDVSFANRCQANLLLGLFNYGYRVDELGHSGLVLSWKSRRLVSASLWASVEPDL